VFNRQTAEMIALALEGGDKDLTETLVCRECSYGWRSPDPNELKASLETSANKRLREIAPWIHVARIMLHGGRRVIKTNTYALRMIYGIPPKRIMDDLSIIHLSPIDPEIVRMLIPFFDGKRSYFCSQDCDGNLIIERVIGRSPREGQYQSVREIIDVVPAGARIVEDVLREKGFYHNRNTHKPRCRCVSHAAHGCLALCPPGFPVR